MIYGIRLFMHAGAVCGYDLRVTFHHFQGSMPKQVLQGEQIAPVAQVVGSKRMTE